MEASTDFFISLVECNSIIYDKSSKDFKNVVKKDEAWVRISKNSHMTVEAAKKRYVSLRQKYCREKQKMETQRRTKSKPVRPWVFYDRLQFLDEFIQPRSTYTNDTGYQDIAGSSFFPADNASTALAEEHAMDLALAEINQNQLDPESFNDNEIGNGGSEERIVSYTPEDVQEHNSFEFIDNSSNFVSTVLSKYSGQLCTYHPATDNLPCTTRIEESEPAVPCPVTNNSACTTGDEALSTRDVTNDLACSVRDEESEPVRGTITNSGCATDDVTRKRTLPSAYQIASNNGNFGGKNTLQTLTQQNVPLSDLTLRRSALAAKSKAHDNKSLPSSSTRVSQTKVNPKTVEPHATTSSLPCNDQGLEAVRNKLDSCITSLNTKISEKQQRSPHAPFLAYLGTKLPNVVKEDLATLEKRILDLVDSYCQ